MIHALHGNFGLPSHWDAALPPGVPAKAWHLWEIRRHHPEARTLTGFATWFNNQIEALPPDPHRLLAGYSLGGRLSLHVIADRPDLWSRAVIISAHPGLTTDAERDARLTHDAAWGEQCRTGLWPEVWAAWNAQPILKSGSSLTDPSGLESWREEIADAFLSWSLGHQKNLLSAVTASPCTGLWLAGSEDAKFTALAKTSCNLLPGFVLQLIPQGGHRLLGEQSDAIRACIQSLIARTQ